MAWSPSASRSTARSSSATLRSSSSRARSATAGGASSRSTYGVPRHSASASVDVREALRDHVVGQPRWLPPGAAGAQPAVHAADQPVEPGRVEVVLRHPQRVAGGDGDQDAGRRARRTVGLEGLAQPGDVGLERVGDRIRWRVAPEQVDERVDRDRVAAGQGESGDQRPLLAGAEVDLLVIAPDLGGAQHAHAHGVRIRLRHR